MSICTTRISCAESQPYSAASNASNSETGARQVAPSHTQAFTPPATGCGSGLPATIAGVAILHVRFANTNAHNQQGTPTAATTEISPGLPTLLEAERTCDFEAVVVWALGLSQQVDFRVTELDNPPRIAVDVAHP